MRRNTVEEPDDAVTLLRVQQREIDGILGSLALARSTAEKAGLVAECGDLVAVHLALVRLVLRPVFISLGHDHACLAGDAQRELSDLLAELLDRDVEEAGFDVLSDTLRERIGAYVADVESCALRDLRTRLPQTRLRYLAHEMRVFEFELRVNLEPRRAIPSSGRARLAEGSA